MNIYFKMEEAEFIVQAFQATQRDGQRRILGMGELKVVRRDWELSRLIHCLLMGREGKQ